MNKLYLKSHYLVACILVLFSAYFSFISAQAVSCIEQVNISLNHDCEFTFSESDILTQSNPAGPYVVMLTTASGSVVLSNLVTDVYLWTSLTAKVTNVASGNSCWGTVNVEDKLGPTIVCAQVEIECFAMHDFVPTATDNCSGDAIVTIVSSATENLNCDPDYVKKITQTYEAVDAYGNTSSCSQDIFLKRFDTSTVIWPEDKIISDASNLTCQDSLNTEGTPHVYVSGVPTVILSGEVVDLYPLNDTYCNVSLEYRDVVVLDFGCSKKIMRTWYLYEWTCTTSEAPLTNVQTIEIQDTENPKIISCNNYLAVITDGAPGCSANVTLSLPVATDDCSGIFEIDVTYDGGFINNATGDQTLSLSGSSLVKFTIYDKCDNSATCETLVEVSDDRNPVAVCDQNSVVSLRLDGTASAYSPTFDDGSYDDCDLYKTVISRMTPDCNCDKPTFSDLNYLGEHNGHYYYISNWAYSARNAIELAQAVDGQLLVVDTQEESDWITNSLSGSTDSLLIGLYSKLSNGFFNWVDHTSLSVTNWAAGQVSSNGQAIVSGDDFVVINESGVWEIVSGTDKYKYILELENPCGFSDKVSFCCSDAGTIQQVVFRAIDASGLTNDCMVNIAVQDKIAPQITCPPAATFACNAVVDFTDVTLFGNFTATDQCAVDADFLTVNEDDYNAACGTGQVTRTFVVTDASGSSSSCTQVLTPTGASVIVDSDIIWPDDEDVSGCTDSTYSPDNFTSGYPTTNNITCGSLSQPTYEDRVYSFSGQGTVACAKIVRTWTIIDWCQTEVDGITPVSFIHQQTIKITNTTAPIIDTATCEPLTVNANNCTTGTVTFITNAIDDCATTLNNVTGLISVDIGADGAFENEYEIIGSNYIFSTELPIGSHSLLIGYRDACGNQSACTKVVNVIDGTAPLVKCKNLAVPIQAMDIDNDPGTDPINMVMLDAELFVESVSYPCGTNNSYSISYSSDAMDNIRVFNCDDEEDGTVTIDLFLIDISGSSQICSVQIELQDPDNLCQNNGGGGGGGDTFLLTGCDPETFSFTGCTAQGPMLNMEFSPIAPACNIAGDFFLMVEVDYFNDGVIDIIETGMTSSGYSYNLATAPGNHSIGVRYIDPCGNSAYCIKDFTVECNNMQSSLQWDNCEDEFVSQLCLEGDTYLVHTGVYDENGICTIIDIIAEIDYNSDGTIDDVIVEADLIDVELELQSGIHTIYYAAQGCNGNIQGECTKQVTIECDPFNLVFDACIEENHFIACGQGESVPILMHAFMETGGCEDLINIEASVDLFSDGIIDTIYYDDEFSDIEFTLEGNHTVFYEASGCGETASCNRVVDIQCFSELNIDGCFDESVTVFCNETMESAFFFAAFHEGSCNETPFIIVEVDLNGDGTIDISKNSFNGFIDVSVTSPGNHLINVTATACGISETCTKTVNVTCQQNILLFGCGDESYTVPCDLDDPTPTLQVDFAAMGCTDLASWDVRIDLNNDGTQDDQIIVNDNTFIRPYSLPLGQHSVFYHVIACGDTASCTEIITINCTEAQMGKVTGTIHTEDAQPIDNVEIYLNGANVAPLMTGEGGTYAFSDMPYGSSYNVEAVKDIDYLDGVSTLDLIEIQRHILGVSLLDSPYKLIAADVDKSGSINGIDLIELRKLILGIYAELPKNTSWRMVDEAYDFPNLLDPFSSTFAESYIIDNLEGDMEIDFVGVKIGDVNNSASSFTNNTVDARSDNKVELIVRNEDLLADALSEVIISGKGDKIIDGFQLALKWDVSMVDVIKVIPLVDGLNASHINSTQLANGVFLISFNNTTSIDLNQDLFKVLVTANKDILVEEMFSVASGQLQSEAYSNGEIAQFILGYDQQVADNEAIKLYQNNPNPWSNNTDIKFYLPKVNKVHLNIYNLNGVLLYSEAIEGKRGINVASISKEQLSTAGVLYYELLSQTTKHVQKMILLD